MALKARWEIRAEKRGEKRGRELGKEAGALSLFLEMVRDRFGEIPADTLERIQSAKPNLVTAWAKVVYRRDTIDEVLAVQP